MSLCRNRRDWDFETWFHWMTESCGGQVSEMMERCYWSLEDEQTR